MNAKHNECVMSVDYKERIERNCNARYIAESMAMTCTHVYVRMSVRISALSDANQWLNEITHD